MRTEILDRAPEDIQANPLEEALELLADSHEATYRGTICEKAAVPMRGLVGEGDVFVESTLIAPISLRTRSFAEGWNFVEDKSIREMEQELDANGWHCFYVVPDVRSTAMSRHRETAINRAVDKVLQEAVQQGLNTVEIAALQVSELFGIHRAKVVARVRHIQESPYLFATDKEMRQSMLRTSARAGLLHVRPWHLGRNYRQYNPF